MGIYQFLHCKYTHNHLRLTHIIDRLPQVVAILMLLSCGNAKLTATVTTANVLTK
jgi:hypothetical protein